MSKLMGLVRAFYLCLLTAALSIGCESTEEPPPPAPAATPAPTPEPPPPPPSLTAVATMAALGGSGVTGTVSFIQGADAVSVVVELSGLTPGDHGFHIHETGDCSAADGSSAGGHFNPRAVEHGNRGAEPSHAGDLGNIEADESGAAVNKFAFSGFTLNKSDASIIGRAVVVHEKADDVTTQPAGASGARIACGVIAKTGGKAPAAKAEHDKAAKGAEHSKYDEGC
jgi:Cu-Zn family superoxide dismutase